MPVRAVERFLFAPGPESRLAVVQRLVAGVVGLRVALGPYGALAGQPDELWRPRGVTQLFDQMPGATTIFGLRVLGTAAALVVAFAPTRWRGRRAAMAVAWFALLILAGLRTSTGKILHNDIPLVFVGLVLVVAPFDASPRGRRREARFGWPVAVATALIAGAYFFTGYQKLVHSGLSWVASDNMQNVMAWSTAGDRAPTRAVSGFIAERLWLSQALAAAAMALELTFPVVLFRSRLRPYYAVAAAVFHAGIWVAMGLDYWAWVAVDLAVLVDWERVASTWARAPAVAVAPVRP